MQGSKPVRTMAATILCLWRLMAEQSFDSRASQIPAFRSLAARACGSVRVMVPRIAAFKSRRGKTPGACTGREITHGAFPIRTGRPLSHRAIPRTPLFLALLRLATLPPAKLSHITRCPRKKSWSLSMRMVTRSARTSSAITTFSRSSCDTSALTALGPWKSFARATVLASLANIRAIRTTSAAGTAPVDPIASVFPGTRPMAQQAALRGLRRLTRPSPPSQLLCRPRTRPRPLPRRPLADRRPPLRQRPCPRDRRRDHRRMRHRAGRLRPRLWRRGQQWCQRAIRR
mmetsp:Transcript_7467/g.21106  ORF Transcript_7467/g.21106 Transcript_7467/m.21106 type:complete len:287 (+) Transcript_7467:1021-1881(+)